MVMGFVDMFVYTEQDPTANAKSGPGATQVVLAHQIRKKPDGSGMGELLTAPKLLKFGSCVDIHEQLLRWCLAFRLFLTEHSRDEEPLLFWKPDH